MEPGNAPRIGIGHREVVCQKYLQNQTSNDKSFGPDTILLQGHAVTLALKVATQMLHATCCLNMVIISVNSCKLRLQIKSYGPETILLKGHTVTLTFKVATQMLCATCRLNMVIIYVK